MCVIVSLKMALDATATTLSQLESQIEEAGRTAMKAALKQAIRGIEAQQSRCPAGGSDQFQTRGTKRRVLLTRFGRVEVPLQRRRCQACRLLFRPAECCLAEVKGHHITPEVRDLAALVGSSWPYEPAAGVRKRLSGVQLSDERLRQIPHEQGRAVAQAQREQAEKVLQAAVSMEQIRAEREQSAQMPRAGPPDWVQVGLDGGWVPSREQAGGMEGKIGVLASQMEAVGKRGRHRLSRRRYVATFGPAEEVGRRAYAAACELGATEALQPVVLGDGADWIKTQADVHFPDAVKVLDWPHLWRKVQAAVRALQPGKRPTRRAWRKAQDEVLLPLLWTGERAQALAHLHRLRSSSGEVPPALADAIRSPSDPTGLVGHL